MNKKVLTTAAVVAVTLLSGCTVRHVHPVRTYETREPHVVHQHEHTRVIRHEKEIHHTSPPGYRVHDRPPVYHREPPAAKVIIHKHEHGAPPSHNRHDRDGWAVDHTPPPGHRSKDAHRHSPPATVKVIEHRQGPPQTGHRGSRQEDRNRGRAQEQVRHTPPSRGPASHGPQPRDHHNGVPERSVRQERTRRDSARHEGPAETRNGRDRGGDDKKGSDRRRSADRDTQRGREAREEERGNSGRDRGERR